MVVASETNPHANRWRGKPLHEWAVEQIGIVEATDNNDGVPSKLFMGGRKEAWCGHFVAEGYRQIGNPLPGDIVPTAVPDQGCPFASVSYTEAVFAEKGWFLPAATQLLLASDLIFLLTRGLSDKTKPGAKPGRHIGIVLFATTTHVVSVEGNWGNAVKKVSRLRTDKTISGYGRRP